MSDVITVAIITGVCSVIGQWLISRANAEKKQAEDAAREARLDERLKAVERRLDSHNHYAEKFSEAAISIAEIQKDIKTLYKLQEG